jgi:hypothetical protein
MFLKKGISGVKVLKCCSGFNKWQSNLLYNKLIGNMLAQVALFKFISDLPNSGGDNQKSSFA